jgi:PhnB protein
MVNPIPEGMSTVTPYLIIKDAAEAIEFYQKAFGAEVKSRMDIPGVGVGHAEIQIGDSRIMIASGCPKMEQTGKPLGNSMIHLYLEDVDALAKQAKAAGAKEDKDQPIRDQPYGDRGGLLVDPFGVNWWVATHKEDLKPEEIEQRVKAEFEKMGQAQKKSA